ncbi:helix-turn-helix transcriptional regulator [Pedobacter heparinus]|uniref:helix-turn-helix domain-containing protein n=1 Tax=Pedobacter heparinus TaxID=984 RepID=UPI00292CB816|nr:helix-turn-helix transcriptional regulator [Pedobacter heparinus]
MKVALTPVNSPEDLEFEEHRFYVEMGLIIRNCRRAKNFSQEYMAAKLKISQNAYSKIETGKCSCSVYRLAGILTLLDLEPQNILIARRKHLPHLEMSKI